MGSLPPPHTKAVSASTSINIFIRLKWLGLKLKASEESSLCYGPPQQAVLLVSPVLFGLSMLARKAGCDEMWERSAPSTLAADLAH